MNCVKLLTKQCAETASKHNKHSKISIFERMIYKEIYQAMDNENWDKVLFHACELGNTRYIKYAVKRVEYFESGLHGACKSGNKKIVKDMIKRGANNFSNVSYYVGLSGNIDLADYLIECGVSKLSLRGCCEMNHLEMIKYFMKLGANDFNYGLEGACKGGHLNIAEMMIELGANDFNHALLASCAGDNLELLKLCLNNGADKYNGALAVSCRHGARNCIEYLIDRIEHKNKLKFGLYGACLGNRLDIYNMMINKGASISGSLIEKVANNINGGGIELFNIVFHAIVDYLVKHEKSGTIQQYEKILIKKGFNSACLAGNYIICSYILNNYAVLIGLKTCINSFTSACSKRNTPICELLLNFTFSNKFNKPEKNVESTIKQYFNIACDNLNYNIIGQIFEIGSPNLKFTVEELKAGELSIKNANAATNRRYTTNYRMKCLKLINNKKKYYGMNMDDFNISDYVLQQANNHIVGNNLPVIQLGNIQPIQLNNVQPIQLGNIQPIQLYNVQPIQLGNVQPNNNNLNI